MRTPKILFLIAVAVFTSTLCAQVSQSLGDAARQARLQKQQNDAKAKEATTSSNTTQPAKPPKKVVTNEDIPEQVGSTLTSPSHTDTAVSAYTPSGPRKLTAEQWKTLIQAEKNALASQQRQIDRLSGALQHPETCIADCSQRNERQREEEVRLDAMKAQLDQRQKKLEELQEAARKQGFGSAVYDP